MNLTKEEINRDLQIAVNEFINYIKTFSDEELEQKVNEKWSINDTVEHLIYSTKPLNLALKVPKLILKIKFGTMNRQPLAFEKIKKKYKQALGKGFVGNNPFGPKEKQNLSSIELQESYQLETKKLIKIVSKWDEEKLDKCVLPHPLLGKLSVREMLYFTIIHTYHHLKPIKKHE